MRRCFGGKNKAPSILQQRGDGFYQRYGATTNILVLERITFNCVNFLNAQCDIVWIRLKTFEAASGVFNRLSATEFPHSENRWNSSEEHSFMNKSTLLNIVHSKQCAQLDYFSTTCTGGENTDNDPIDEQRTRPDLCCSTPCTEGSTSIQDWLSNLVYESAANAYGEQITRDNDSSLSSVVHSESIFDSFESFGKPDYPQVKATDDQKPGLGWNYYHSCTKAISSQGNSISTANSNLMSYPYSGFLSTYGSVHSQLRYGGPLCSQHEFVRNICDTNIYSTTVHSSSLKYTVDQEQSAIAHQTSEHQTHPETISYVFRNAANQQQDVTSFLPNDHIFGGFDSNDQAAVCCSSPYMNEWNHLDTEFIEHKRDLDRFATFRRGNPLEYRKSSHYSSPSCCEQMGLDTKEYPITADTFNFLDSTYAWEPSQNPARAGSGGKFDENYIGVQSKCRMVNTSTGLTVCASGSPNRTPGNYQKNIECGTPTQLSNFTTEYLMNSTNTDHSSDHLGKYYLNKITHWYSIGLFA
ncbi:hypothetical protein P879_08504 [Paragonimus westermani]|uniref:Uncharacterized protein n=1 Tax=Paragonimus westermani TaxID=34504 RepID=A0A8T0DFZ1_9TREM|nr:hypothetical protein P879_08504 [Paragonimus westermani]